MDRKIIILIFLPILIAGTFYINYNNKSISGANVADFNDANLNKYADYSPDRIIIPIKAHTIRDDSGYYTSSRDEANIMELFNGVNRIWQPADIYFSIEEIVITETSFEAIPNAINGNYDALYENDNFSPERLNVFFTQSLNGINGLALFPLKSILVSDFTTVNDFRTTAHELGHLLRLGHVNDSDRLMARGKNGESLSDEEIVIARQNALGYI